MLAHDHLADEGRWHIRVLSWLFCATSAVPLRRGNAMYMKEQRGDERVERVSLPLRISVSTTGKRGLWTGQRPRAP